jgi:hypothetical protein
MDSTSQLTPDLQAALEALRGYVEELDLGEERDALALIEQRIAELERERDYWRMLPGRDLADRAERAEARIADLEWVVEAARVVSEIERTGVLPDFMPLADALAALDVTPDLQAAPRKVLGVDLNPAKRPS